MINTTKQFNHLEGFIWFCDSETNKSKLKVALEKVENDSSSNQT